MNDVSKYKVQLTIALLMFLVVAYTLKFNPASGEIEYFEVFVESGIALTCLFLMFWTERLNFDNSRLIYKLLLVSCSFLFIGHTLDAIDEVSMELALFDFLEDIFKPLGFFLFVFANFRWVEFHRQQSKEMKRLAEIDPLTGLFNRRALIEKGNDILYHSLQSDRLVSVIIIDIDHFKSVNDNYGHQVGDQVLVEISSAIKGTLRKSDYMARVGGEEFVVLLYDTSIDEATLVAEKIRTCVEHLKMAQKQYEVSCTISMGLAADYERDGCIENLIGKADQALYQAKAQGRNCWKVAQGYSGH